MSTTISTLLSHTLDEQWLRAPAMVLGSAPGGEGTPRCHVCLSTPHGRLRVDVHVDRGEHCFHDEATVIEGTLFIGVGERVFVVDLATRNARQHGLDSYFGYLYSLPDGVLVASGCSLSRLDLDGSLRWAAVGLAVDGLLVREIRDGRVIGDAERDPPGGWEVFCVSLDSGVEMIS